MASVRNQFEKLPGRASYLFGVSKLWAHPEYLLAVTTYFGVESYQRYFLRDIQALMIQRTKVRFWWNLAFGTCGALVGLVGLTFWQLGRQWEGDEEIGWTVVLGILMAIAGVFLVALIWNSVRGATCNLVAQMATGPQPLPGVTRMRAARKVLERITPRIVEAQGSTPPPPLTA